MTSTCLLKVRKTPVENNDPEKIFGLSEMTEKKQSEQVEILMNESTFTRNETTHEIQTNVVQQEITSCFDKTADMAASRKEVQPLAGKRKTQEQMRELINYYHLYEGHWDEKNFASLIIKTGFNKK